MLVDVTLRTTSPVLAVIAMVNSRETESQRIDAGLYLSGHWNFNDAIVEQTEQYPSLPDDYWCYGVCDSPQQLLEAMPFLRTSPNRYVVSFVELNKANEPPRYGWRWHKWGDYIGNQSPQCEYLFDEPVIERA